MIKRIASIALFCLGMFVATGISAQSSDDNVNIVINNETTREQLWEMRQDLQELGIKFEYQPEFDNTRKLIAINLKVTTDDGYNGNYQTSLADDDQQVRIIRNYDENAEVAFCVGTCND